MHLEGFENTINHKELQKYAACSWHAYLLSIGEMYMVWFHLQLMFTHLPKKLIQCNCNFVLVCIMMQIASQDHAIINHQWTCFLCSQTELQVRLTSLQKVAPNQINPKWSQICTSLPLNGVLESAVAKQCRVWSMCHEVSSLTGNFTDLCNPHQICQLVACFLNPRSIVQRKVRYSNGLEIPCRKSLNKYLDYNCMLLLSLLTTYLWQ